MWVFWAFLCVQCRYIDVGVDVFVVVFSVVGSVLVCFDILILLAEALACRSMPVFAFLVGVPTVV